MFATLPHPWHFASGEDGLPIFGGSAAADQDNGARHSKFFNTTKGFGFIQPDNGGKDVFVHISAVQKSGLEGLYENDKVTFELENGRDGKISATNLTLVE